MKTRRGVRKSIWLLSLFLVMATYSSWALLKPLPGINPDYRKEVIFKKTSPDLVWAATGQSAVKILDADILVSNGPQVSVPMASTAKVITALMALQKKPLSKGEAGPIYTITPADYEIYKNYVAQDGTVLPVTVGLQLTEYQMLEAMMLPSANNIADTMAIWTYGSLPAYSKAANAFLKSKGIMNTQVGKDASGLSPDSKTTASDLVTIGSLAMKHSVLSEVVSKSSTTDIPGNPLVRNVNALLGKNGIVGIKTGTSNEAGGVLLGAAKNKVNGKEITIISAVVGESSRPAALAASLKLVESAQKNFKTTTADVSDLATYRAPWGETHKARISEDVSINSWQGEQIKVDPKLTYAKVSSTKVGRVEIAATASSTKKAYNVELDKEFNTPSIWWRLTNPL